LQSIIDVRVLVGFKVIGAIRPYCHTDHYWQVYFATNKVIRETCGAAGYPVPEQHFVVRNS